MLLQENGLRFNRNYDPRLGWRGSRPDTRNLYQESGSNHGRQPPDKRPHISTAECRAPATVKTDSHGETESTANKHLKINVRRGHQASGVSRAQHSRGLLFFLMLVVAWLVAGGVGHSDHLPVAVLPGP